MDLSLLLTLGVIHTVALISPGPDFAIMVKIATQQHRNTALAAAAGISVAILAHTILSLTGVSLVIKSSYILYLVVQIAGASYLAWMGFSALRSGMAIWRKPLASVDDEANDNVQDTSADSVSKIRVIPMSQRQGFLTGLYTNLLNPKALVFFLTLFSALITPDVTASTKLVSAVLLFVLSLAWFGLLAVMLSKAQVQLKLQRLTPIIDVVIGVIFMSVAVAIVTNLVLTA
ncbi:LysE family translocator [Shewanella glacialipiscicola]|uniref:LysE family translocator n=1 Tax=Shewanella glacialipiscicola TaxID=614069 RepID=UPI0021DA3F26|nr:LysE family translocator [Shewanella glacialipiscicola]MCU7994051.1 LysE family translocator [Shewanella glacialipiscicola]MCU8025369.1 LysE family translocator [Shewanella glacialipiscicola]